MSASQAYFCCPTQIPAFKHIGVRSQYVRRKGMMKSKLVIAAIVAAVVGAFVLGVVDRDAALGWVRYVFFRARGEASSIGSNLGKPVGTVEQARLCRQTLERIQAAKRKAAQDRGNTVGEVTWEETIKAMYPQEAGRLTHARITELMPKCPCGGTYTLMSLIEVPRCSISGNNSVNLEIGHIIRF